MKNIINKKYLLICLIIILINPINYSVLASLPKSDSTQTIKTSLEPGDYYQNILSNGRIRSYWLHIPPSYTGENPTPLVFVLHGSGVGANAITTKTYSDIDKKADEEGFITVYPNGEMLRLSRYLKKPIAILWDIYYFIQNSREWNRWDDNNIDDVGYINDIIDHLITNLNVNTSRIYVTGVSGGAMMTYRLGAELSDRIAAIAPIAGSIGGLGFVREKNDSLTPYIIPQPKNPMPVIIFHGLQDESVPYDGGWKQVFNWGSNELWVYTVSINESITFWIDHNNCDTNPQINMSESGLIITSTYKNGDENTDVVLVTYINGGHEWFRSPPHEISATDQLWDFFKQHPK